MKQFVPNEVCLKCQICCRFSDRVSVFRPVFLNQEIDTLLKETGERDFFDRDNRLTLKKYGRETYCCPFFEAKDNRCSVYSRRPLDCRLYPFVIAEQKEKIFLGIDLNCPYAYKNYHSAECSGYADYLIDYLHSRVGIEGISLIASDYGDYLNSNGDTISNGVKLFKEIIPRRNLQLNDLTLADKEFIEKYLRLKIHRLFTYSFASIYIWKDFFKIKYAVFRDNLLVFFENGAGMFLYLAPLGRDLDLSVIEFVRDYLLSQNSNRGIARIDNLEQEEAEELRRAGFNVQKRGTEYVYLREELLNLRGDKFKSKRASLNHFLKNHTFNYRPYEEKDIDAVSSLLQDWIRMREDESKGKMYNWMLKDCLRYHREAFENYKDLGLLGRVVEVDGRLGAYSFGFKLNPDTFCIMLEVADLRIKGLAQFIFREFCREREERFINVMDDSGLENLRNAKLSFHPVRLEDSYSVLFD